MSVPHVEVVSAVTGESISDFEKEEFADASVKAFKKRLAQKIGIPRFRLRLLQDSCPLDDDQTLAPGVVQLVRMEFLPPDMEQDREIMVACEENDDKLLEKHLNQPRNPNFEDANGITPLCAASLNGSLNCAFLLIEAGADKEQGLTHDGTTPLFIAAQNGHLEVVRFLVESGASKDQCMADPGISPLYIAAQEGHLEIVQFLVESGANKDQGTTDDGGTPLFIAACMGHLEVVRFLVETDDGTTPLFAASQNGHLEVVRLLVESGANKDQGCTDGGVTPLFIAAEHGHLDVVRFLVESGANRDQGTTDDGGTPLFIAACMGHLEVVRFLVESGANKDKGRTNDGATPLYMAAHQGHLEVVRFWLGPVPTKTKARQTMEKRLLSLLFSKDTLRLSDVWWSQMPTRSKAGQTWSNPSFIAAEKGHLEVVRCLVVSGADKDQGMTDYEATPPFIAARHLEVVRFLARWLSPSFVVAGFSEEVTNKLSNLTDVAKKRHQLEQRVRADEAFKLLKEHNINITRAIFQAWLQDGEFVRVLDEADVDISNRFELFNILDVDLGGELSPHELLTGLLSLRGEVTKGDVIYILLRVRDMTHRMEQLQEDVKGLTNRPLQRLT
eukprot:symbB.v1.2.026879.t1/scaffold2721.1/size72280/4